MSLDLSQVATVLQRVRTPMTLAGLAVIGLYALYSQVLELDIFAQLDAAGTESILTRLIDYVFYIAIVAVVLGVVGYLLRPRGKPSTADHDQQS